MAAHPNHENRRMPPPQILTTPATIDMNVTAPTTNNVPQLQPPPPRIEVCGPPPNNQPTPIDFQHQSSQDDMCQTDHLNKQLLEAFLKRINDSSRFRTSFDAGNSNNSSDPLVDSTVGGGQPREDPSSSSSSESISPSTNPNNTAAAATESF